MLPRAFVEQFGHDASKTLHDLFTNHCNEISHVIDVLFYTWCHKGTVFIMGNGGSASTASHFAADLVKTINDVPGERGLRALTPWDNIPAISAIVNDRPKESFFEAWLDTFFPSEKGVPVVGIGLSVHGGSGSSHGGAWSQNLLRGLQYIQDRGGTTIGFSGFDGGAMKDLVDISIVVPADSTPLVESLHVMLHHCIAFGIKGQIEEFNNTQKRGAA